MAALACAAIASNAHAGVHLDQASVAETGPAGDLAGSGISPRYGLGQSFTAGRTGRLARIDLGIFDPFYSEPAGGFTFLLENGAGDVLYTAYIDFSELPEQIPFGMLLDDFFQLDLSAANVRVAAGEAYRMVATGDPGSDAFAPGWFYRVDESGSHYPGGSAFLRVAACDCQSPRLDYAFRTYVATPEPGAWTLMILGFGGVGAALRRRQVAAGA